MKMAYRLLIPHFRRNEEAGLLKASLTPVRLRPIVDGIFVAEQTRPRGVALPAEGADVLEGVLRLRRVRVGGGSVGTLALPRAAALLVLNVKNEPVLVVVVVAHFVYHLCGCTRFIT